MTNGSLTKEFHKLLKTVSKLSDSQAKVSDWDDEDVSKFKVEIAPNGGPYSGGKFIFQIELGESFPETPPSLIRCETQIYHPNIDSTEEYGESNICLNMFNSDEWVESFGIDDVIQGLLFLFYEPCIEDPLSPYFDSEMSMEDYFENVLLSLRGETVEGVDYPWNYGDEKINKQESEKPEVLSEIVEGNNATDKGGESDSTSNSLENNNGESVTEVNDSMTFTADTKIGKAEKPVTPQPQSDPFCFFPKTKEVNVPSNVLYEMRENPPDVVLATRADGPCVPDVTKTGQAEILLIDSMEGKNFWGNKSVSLNSFDAVMPEMNLVFTLMNNVTKTIVMKT